MTSSKPCAVCGLDGPDALMDYIYEDKRFASRGAGYEVQTLRYNLTLPAHTSCIARSSRLNRILGGLALLGFAPLLLLILAQIIAPGAYNASPVSRGDLIPLLMGGGMLLTFGSGGTGLIIIPWIKKKRISAWLARWENATWEKMQPWHW